MTPWTSTPANMPLYSHPTISTSLLLAPSGKLAGSSACCCGIGTCDGLQNCFGVAGTAASRDLQVRFQDIADAGCASCDENLNDTFLFSDGQYSTTGGSVTNFTPGTCCVTYGLPASGAIDLSFCSAAYRIRAGIGVQGLTAGVQRSAGGLPFVTVAVFYLEDADGLELGRLCGGAEIQLPLLDDDGVYCDYSAASCFVSLP